MSDSGTVEPIPDTGEGRVRADAYLTILNTELPPHDLAAMVELEADEGWAKGEHRRIGKPHPFNGVSFRSGLDEQATPTEHFAALIERLEPYVERIARVADLPTTNKAHISVVEHTQCDNVESEADPQQLALVAAMHATLGFDVYFYGDDDEDSD